MCMQEEFFVIVLKVLCSKKQYENWLKLKKSCNKNSCHSVILNLINKNVDLISMRDYLHILGVE